MTTFAPRMMSQVGHDRAAQWISAGLLCCAILLIVPLDAARAQRPVTAADSIPVASITIVGNKAFGEGTLLDLLETREHPGALALFLNNISERLPFAAPPQ